jgi:phosphomevalonate kinase
VNISASAPGKLVLSGEYAVLEGAPAIAMAINRRARVVIESVAGDHHTVRAPGYSDVSATFRTSDSEFEWLDDGEDYALLRHVWQEAGARFDGSKAITLDTSAFVDEGSGAKIGIGSSAALASALATALAPAGADPTRIAFDAHRHFQGGLGSGIDIACSTSGGLIGYTVSDAASHPLRWPEGLHFGVIWVGVPADTRKRLIKLEQQSKRASSGALIIASRRMAEAWNGGVAQEVLRQYVDYIAVLREFSIDHDLGIFDAGHAELTDAAGKAGVVYKPCGAGGGDTGIVFAEDAVAVDEFLSFAVEHGAHRLDLEIDKYGARIDRDSS